MLPRDFTTLLVAINWVFEKRTRRKFYKIKIRFTNTVLCIHWCVCWNCLWNFSLLSWRNYRILESNKVSYYFDVHRNWKIRSCRDSWKIIPSYRRCTCVAVSTNLFCLRINSNTINAHLWFWLLLDPNWFNTRYDRWWVFWRFE